MSVLALPTRYRLDVRNKKRHFAFNTEQTLQLDDHKAYTS